MDVKRRNLLLGAGVAAVAAAGAAYWLWGKPRVIGVCVVTDYSFRERRSNWSEALDARFAGVNRIFRGTGVQWAFRHADEPDPTGKIDGMEERRQKLVRAECRADVLLLVTGRPESPAAGDVPAFAHTAIVVNNPKASEEQNTRMLAHGMARLFGAPVDATGAGTVMTLPPEGDRMPKPAAKLIGALAEYNFAKGGDAMDEAWDRRAFQALTRAYEARGPSAERAAHRAMGMALAAEQMFPTAIRHLEEAARLDPNNAMAHVELATMYTHGFQPAEAVKEYREAVRLQPNDARNHAGLAVALANQAKGEEAIEEFQKALAIDPKFASAQAGLAYILSQQLGRIDESIAAYQLALEMNPNLPAATAGLERAKGFKEKSQAMAAEQRRKAQEKPSSAAAQFDLGLSEARAGNIEPAVKAFRRALELDSGNGRAHANLAMLLYLQKDYPGALRAARTASTAGFDPPPALVELLKRKAGQ